MLPGPYPDELFFGYLGRLRTYCLAATTNSLNRQMLGTTTVHASADFLRRARTLALHAEATTLSPDDLVWKHTLAPYCLGFWGAEERADALTRVTAEALQGLHLAMGVSCSRVKHPEFFRYCSRCWREAEDEYGEVFVKRLFQLPGVLVCPAHRESLCDTAVHYPPVSAREHHHFLLSDGRPGSGVQLSADGDMGRAVALAEASRRLLNQGRRVGTHMPLLRQSYHHALRRLGLGANNIRPRHLETAFLEIFPMRFLALFGLAFEPGKESNWLRTFVRDKRRHQHPLLHLLFRCFVEHHLGSDCWTSLANETWPCFNPLQPHPGPVRVSVCRLHHDAATRTWWGIFQCACGFRYSGVGGGLVRPESMSLRKVVAHSPDLKAQVHDLAAKGRPVSEIAKNVGVDGKTAIDILAATGGDRRKLHTVEKTLNDRKAWLEHVAKNPGASRLLLRRLAPALFSRVHVHDHTWLLSLDLPRAEHPRRDSREYWRDLDADLSIRLAELADVIGQRIPLQRVSQSRLGRELGVQNLLTKRIAHLPLCREILGKYVESIEQFQIRRLKRLLAERPVWTSRFALMRAAGLLNSCLRPATAELVDDAVSGRRRLCE